MKIYITIMLLINALFGMFELVNTQFINGSLLSISIYIIVEFTKYAFDNN